MNILADEEMKKIHADTFGKGVQSFARAIEAAVLSKLAEQPVNFPVILAVSQAREQQANECRIALVHQIHELADHIERAEYCINDIDMLKQMRGQRAYAMKVASQWNQNGNPFANDTATLDDLKCSN